MRFERNAAKAPQPILFSALAYADVLLTLDRGGGLAQDLPGERFAPAMSEPTPIR